MIRERRLRDADGHLEFPERPLAVRKEFDDDLARDILSEDREDPPLGLHERPRDEIPLAMPVLFRLQEAAPLEVPEVVGKHPGGHAERLADPTEMDARVRRQEIVDSSPALKLQAFRHSITAVARGTGTPAPRGSGPATRSPRRRRPSWPALRSAKLLGRGRWKRRRSAEGNAAPDVGRTIGPRRSPRSPRIRRTKP